MATGVAEQKNSPSVDDDTAERDTTFGMLSDGRWFQSYTSRVQIPAVLSTTNPSRKDRRGRERERKCAEERGRRKSSRN